MPVITEILFTKDREEFRRLGGGRHRTIERRTGQGLKGRVLDLLNPIIREPYVSLDPEELRKWRNELGLTSGSHHKKQVEEPNRFDTIFDQDGFRIYIEDPDHPCHNEWEDLIFSSQ